MSSTFSTRPMSCATAAVSGSLLHSSARAEVSLRAFRRSFDASQTNRQRFQRLTQKLMVGHGAGPREFELVEGAGMLLIGKTQAVSSRQSTGTPASLAFSSGSTWIVRYPTGMVPGRVRSIGFPSRPMRKERKAIGSPAPGRRNQRATGATAALPGLKARLRYRARRPNYAGRG